MDIRKIGFSVIGLSVIGLSFCSPLRLQGAQSAGSEARIMTYNIQWFHNGDSPERIQNIKTILSEVKPDVVGVQEIEGLAALKQVFPESDWQIGIKDLPEEFQECGIVVRKTWKLESYELIFSGRELDYPFPGSRDVLRAVVSSESGKSLVVYVHHFKSRSGGRKSTDAQREMAAGMLASYIASKGDKNYVVIGDFNDAPNDRSTNILESGNILAKGGDESPMNLLVNLTEPLLKEDYVSIGLHDLFEKNKQTTAIVAGAKADNDRLRGQDYRFPQDVKVTQSLFDQILVSPSLAKPGQRASIYSGIPALSGKRGRVQVIENKETGSRAVNYTEKGSLASDHLPVYADITVQ